MYRQPGSISTIVRRVGRMACYCLCGWMLAATMGAAQPLAWDSTAGWTGVVASPVVRQGPAGLSLRPFGPLIERYDGFSQPAIGVFHEGSDIQSYPTSFWHDPETDDIYITMIGGGGLTILSPATQSSITYRNRGIWDTSLDAVGQKIREDWQFSPVQISKSYPGSDRPALLSALRRRGTSDVWIAGDFNAVSLLIRKDPLTYVDDALRKDFWALGFQYGKNDLYEDDAGRLYITGLHNEGLDILHPDLKTLVNYRMEGAMVIKEGTIVERYETPKIPALGRLRPLLKRNNGDLLVGHLSWDFYDPTSAEGGLGLVVLSDYDSLSQRYTTSMNYRLTGQYDTTDELGLEIVSLYGTSPVATNGETTIENRISPSNHLLGGSVMHAWESQDGRTFLSTSGGLDVLYPDGRLVNVEALSGRWVYSSIGVAGDVLLVNSDRGIEVLYDDGALERLRSRQGEYIGSVFPHLGSDLGPFRVPDPGQDRLPMWRDRAGHLNASIKGEGVEVYGLNRMGTVTGPPTAIDHLRSPLIRWEAASEGGTTLLLQVRTAADSAAGWSPWRDLDDPRGSAIDLSEDQHAWVQWRAVFERQDRGEASGPALLGVWIEEQTVTAVVEASASLPDESALLANYPNPFNAETVIGFAVGTAGVVTGTPVTLRIYNMGGQRVRTLAAGILGPGAYRRVWDGRDEGGRELASGVYLYRLQVGDTINTRKLLLLR
ncbi:MAG: T9SS type A sorting domain-containing protein [Candidatus Latescibacteria bacterium]|nr:T9SS type A sorting domain-containing protein [Candidatus Latescibacterota bacterium]